MTDESFPSWAWLNGHSLRKSWEDCKRIILPWISFTLKYLIMTLIKHSCSAWTGLLCTSNLYNHCLLDFQIPTVLERKQSKIHFNCWQCGINMRYDYHFVIEETQPRSPSPEMAKHCHVWKYSQITACLLLTPQSGVASRKWTDKCFDSRNFVWPFLSLSSSASVLGDLCGLLPGMKYGMLNVRGNQFIFEDAEKDFQKSDMQ